MIGTPYEHIGSIADAGMVQVFFGAYLGIPQQPRFQNFHQDRSGIADSAEIDDCFGLSVAVLDVTPREIFLPLILKE